MIVKCYSEQDRLEKYGLLILNSNSRRTNKVVKEVSSLSLKISNQERTSWRFERL